jgi:predicted ferric reductase
MSNLKLRSETDIENIDPVVPLPIALSVFAAVLIGTVFALFVVPTWLPGLADSILGPQPMAFWYLSRTSALVGYALMWLSVVLGLLISTRVSRVWPGGPLAVDLHQFTSLLGYAFAFFHIIVLLGDRYINFSVLQLIVPFASLNYSPIWVGLGQIAFYLLIPVTFSFYLRRQIGPSVWRALHYATFIIYAFITVHGLLSGTDTASPWILAFYAATSLVVVFFTFYRILVLEPARA